MVEEYSIEVIRELEKVITGAKLYRPGKIERYEVGEELNFKITEISKPNEGNVRLVIEKFVGGGFAGQVYRVRVKEITSETGPLENLKIGNNYAMKILVPPSGFSRLFRNFIYWVGFQGPFQLQVNPSASRAGALWQKFIRRGAKIVFGKESAVVDIYATFVDRKLGSCGELSEWVDGRTWRLEVDERLDLLKRWIKGKKVENDRLGSPEYRGKRGFMSKFVDLLHQMGAHEFARQYEWSTCKSQPNCLKRIDSASSPNDELVAVDFRAGLALLPFLPMSPGDLKLIIKGLGRGTLVQFDRGDIRKLDSFIDANREEFSDMDEMLSELKQTESVYRKSIPDITHNHVRLLYDRRLWATILDSAVKGWWVRNLIDHEGQEKLLKKRFLTFLFILIGFLPVIGKVILKTWGHQGWRRHYREILTNSSYFSGALKAKLVEKIIKWHRAGRISGKKAIELSKRSSGIIYHLPFSILPAGIHRFITDWTYAKEKIDYLAFRPIRLYFNAEQREQWLREMVDEGEEKQLLTKEDKDTILSQIKEPYIQKYLKSLAVHVCTVPVTQVVSLILAIIYVVTHPDMPRGQAWGIGLGIIALFQVLPISPGSLVRGLYVVYLVIRERNFKDYNIAVFLGFFKYIGYLAFPIQMGYRYPALARFMAAHWATEAVHVVPVFGERGALLEHGIFRLFYNWPLTIRRRMKKRGQIRAKIKPRYWHILLCAIVGGTLFGLIDLVHYELLGVIPGLKQIWWLVVFLPLICGAVVTVGAGGASLAKRIIGAGVCGALIGAIYTASATVFLPEGLFGIDEILRNWVWRVFIFTILSIIGTLLTELKLPEPSAT